MRAHAPIAAWVGWWVGTMLLWLVLTSTVSANEVFIGVVAAALAATAATLTRADRPPASVTPRRALRGLAVLPARIVVDTGRLAVVAGRRLAGKTATGSFREVSTEASTQGDETADTILTSIAPNSVVVEIGDGRVLLHELVPTNRPTIEDIVHRT